MRMRMDGINGKRIYIWNANKFKRVLTQEKNDNSCKRRRFIVVDANILLAIEKERTTPCNNLFANQLPS